MTTPFEAPKLIAAPYQPPRGRAYRVYGAVGDAIRGEVMVCGVSDAPIPWPVARTLPHTVPMPVVTDELARAIRTECCEAVAYHWGVSYWTVRRWRHALGAPRFTAGTLALWKELAPSKLTAEVRAKALRNYLRGVRRRRRAASAAAGAAGRRS